MGWWVMALVDVLEYIPQNHAGQAQLRAILGRAVAALAAVQDASNGLWYQVLDQGGRAGNYLEASGSAMYVYAIARGVRLGYLSGELLPVAERGYRGLLNKLVSVDEHGLVNIDQICGACGLGGNPYRDGSYEYYVTERVIRNDYKGVGAFILAALEMESWGDPKTLG
jgi:unsaturated rhamnogalacturonyl hydrolase